jgi:hypothetical protein
MRLAPFVLAVTFGMGSGLGCSRSSLFDDLPSASRGGSSGASSSGGSGGASSSGGSGSASSSGGSGGPSDSGGSSDSGSSGGSGGSSSLGGSGSSGPCSFANCAGCCLGNKCVLSGSPTDPCGSNGEACTTCPSGYSCFAGGCMQQTSGGCSPANCNGCCFNASMPLPGGGVQGGSTECFLGTQDDYCGSGGLGCQACAPSTNGGHCAADPGVGGHCEGAGTCNATNCAGCCLGEVCAVGMQNVACGLSGAPCQDCSADGGLCITGYPFEGGSTVACGYGCSSLNTSPPVICNAYCVSATDCQ